MGEDMHNVLIVIPAGTEPQRAIRTAIGLAKEKGERLVAVVVITPEVASRVTSALSDVGFVGERVGSQVVETIRHEYRARSEALLRSVGEQARHEGVAVMSTIEEGDAGEICTRLIRAYQVKTAVLVAERQSWLTRFLSRGAAVRLPALSGCEVRVMEED
jgi:nucleotide-binding universal stress UspA family protein